MSQRPTHEIKCADCGQPYQAAHKNTKYCKVCRLYSDVLFLREWPLLKCTACKKEYAPLLREKIPVCGPCQPYKWRDDAEGVCSFCNTESKQLLHEDVTVCRACAQDPEHRASFIGSLAKKRALRCGAPE